MIGEEYFLSNTTKLPPTETAIIKKRGITMVINIFPGTHFSHLELLFRTNRFFGNTIFSKRITKENKHYVLKIRKASVKIITSSNFSEVDITEIRRYIETVFRNKSILIDCTDKSPWLSDIENVSVIFLTDTTI